MTDKQALEARRTLDELAATLATLTKMVNDIEPYYCTLGDQAELYLAASHLELAEDELAEVCANSVEREDG